MVSSSATTFLLWAGYAAATVLTASMATYGLARRDNRVARSFGAVMVGLLLWSLGAFGRLLVPTRAGWHLLTVVMYLGVATTPVLFFRFVAHYTNRDISLSRRRVAALFVVPAGTVSALATTPAHGLFFVGVRSVPFGNGEVLVATSGPLFYVHAAYSYLLLVAGTLLLVWFALESHREYRRQSAAILGGTMVPWATNVVYLFRFGPSFPVDPTPVGFAFGGILLAYAVFGTGVTNLTPVARSAVVDAIDDAVFVVSRTGELVDLNPAARRLTIVDDPLGAPVSSVVPDPLLNAEAEPSAITLDGTERWFRLREVELDGDGAVLLASDLTEQVRRQRQLREQNRRLEQFTRIAAHDLRNPLNAITGYTRLARETGDVSHLDDVDPATDRIETLIDDLLTLGHEGRVVEETAPVSLAAAAERAWNEVNTGGATLEVVGDERLLADESRFNQLLENLFINAVTHGGDDVTVEVGTRPDGFFVADDGTGIPTEDRAEVFEYGYSTHGGTGLGLPVVRSITVAHGWEVSVTDAADGGARFEFGGIQTDPQPFDGIGLGAVSGGSPFE
jgi:signal transduction histidine kinase